MHRGCGACGRRSLTGAGPGRTVRTTGPAKGNPVPARPAAPRLHRRPPKPALGGRLHLRADLVGVLLHRLRHGACSPAGSSAGTPAAARGTDNAAGAPGQAIWTRKDRGGGDLEGLVHHSDHGSQYLSIAYTGRLVDEGIEASAGAVGSSYAGAAAEALGKSYKRELVWRDGPWKDRDDLEVATAQWVNWYNRTRPHRANPDDLSPAAAEHRYHRNHTTTAAAAPATA